MTTSTPSKKKAPNDSPAKNTPAKAPAVTPKKAEATPANATPVKSPPAKTSQTPSSKKAETTPAKVAPASSKKKNIATPNAKSLAAMTSKASKVAEAPLTTDESEMSESQMAMLGSEEKSGAENDGNEEDDNEEEFEMQISKSSKSAFDFGDDDENPFAELSMSNRTSSFAVSERKVNVTSASSMPAISKTFLPYNASTGTSLQQKIDEQLARSKHSYSMDDSEHEPESESDADEADVTSAKQVKSRPAPKVSSNKKIEAKEMNLSESETITDFATLKLSRPLLKAIAEMSWTKPTRVQSACILPAISGKDLLVNAVTGSGKTGAFILPILERLLHRPKRVPLTRVLVLLPTRELAAQCYEVSQMLAKHTDIRICLIVGGLSEKQQEVELRSRPDIVLATPGRLIDHIRNSQSFHLEDIEILVLDEADRLLETGFEAEIKQIIRECPKGRQTMLFSATLTDTVLDLVNLSLRDPLRVKIDEYESLVDRLHQEFVRINTPARGNFAGKAELYLQKKNSRRRFPKKRKRRDDDDGSDSGSEISDREEDEKPFVADKTITFTKQAIEGAIDALQEKEENRIREAMVLSLVKRNFKTKTIIFLPSKVICHRLQIIFGLSSLKSAELQGNMTQMQRLDSLERFRSQEVDFLLCTDLAARGLDIQGVETVINYSLPRDIRQYIHRVGRTARAGREGRAISLVGESERSLLKDIVKRAKNRGKNSASSKSQENELIHSRQIVAPVVNKYREMIDLMDSDIRQIFTLEHEEKLIRQSEMQANRMTNMMTHRDEIMNRPKKTWFQTDEEKKASKERAVVVSKDKKILQVKNADNEIILERPQRHGKYDGLSRKKRRRLQMIDEDNRMASRGRKERDEENESRRSENHGEDDMEERPRPNVRPTAKATLKTLDFEQLQRMQRTSKRDTKSRYDDDEDGGGTRKRKGSFSDNAPAKKQKLHYSEVDMEALSAPARRIPTSFRYENNTRSAGDSRYTLTAKQQSSEKKRSRENEKRQNKRESRSGDGEDSFGNSRKPKQKSNQSFKSKSRFKRR